MNCQHASGGFPPGIAAPLRRAGRGRSGMIALRLMIAGGERPVAALKRLRAVQPEAVETPGQMNWATGKHG